MTVLYRCFPFSSAIKKIEPGHPLYIPASRATGRVNNPDIYSTSYWSAQPECAVAETYGSQLQWSSGTFAGTPQLPHSNQAIAAIEIPDGARIFNLDNAPNLVKLKLPPSQVITRNNAVTQAWARKIFEFNKFVGIHWWSIFWPEWQSYGVWNLTGVKILGIENLSIAHEAVVESAKVLNKQVLGH